MNCVKKKDSLLCELSYAELELLERNRVIADFKKGETIYKKGMKPIGLLALNAGKVKIVRSEFNEKEQIVELKKPVDFIGVRDLMINTSYKNSAVALENSSVCVINKNDFFYVVKNNPNLSLKIIQMFANELDKADTHFMNMTQKHLRARLADAIIQLLDTFGTHPDGKTINCTLKRSDLAGLSNMTTANVIKTISSFKKEGIILSEKKKLVIQNREMLKNISIL